MLVDGSNALRTYILLILKRAELQTVGALVTGRGSLYGHLHKWGLSRTPLMYSFCLAQLGTKRTMETPVLIWWQQLLHFYSFIQSISISIKIKQQISCFSPYNESRLNTTAERQHLTTIIRCLKVILHVVILR